MNDILHELGCIAEALKAGETVTIEPGSVKADRVLRAVEAADAQQRTARERIERLGVPPAGPMTCQRCERPMEERWQWNPLGKFHFRQCSNPACENVAVHDCPGGEPFQTEPPRPAKSREELQSQADADHENRLQTLNPDDPFQKARLTPRRTELPGDEVDHITNAAAGARP